MLRLMMILALCLVLVTIPGGSAFAQAPSESEVPSEDQVKENEGTGEIHFPDPDSDPMDTLLQMILSVKQTDNQSSTEPAINEDVKEREVPNLTPDEKDSLKQIIFSDKDVHDMIGNRQYEVVYTGVWVQGDKLERIGGYLQIAFDEPIVQERDWPTVEYYDKESEREYTDSELATFATGEYLQYRKWGKAEFRQLNIRVDFRTGRVVAVNPISTPPLPKAIREAYAEVLSSRAATTIPHYTTSAIGSDWSYNHDYDSSGNPPPYNIDRRADQPVQIIFFSYDDEFDLDTVKSMYWGANGGSHETIWLNSYDGHWDEDHDKGTTGTPSGYSDRIHMRVYAHDDAGLDYNYDPSWGRYVIATTHWDGNKNGYSEEAAAWFALRAINDYGCGWVSGLDFQNPWAGPWQGDALWWDGHYMQSDGWTFCIYVPFGGEV